MKLPKINQNNLIFYTTLLALTIQDSNGEIYTRKYYRVKYRDTSELIFMTTNELDSDYNKRTLDEDFTLILNLEHLIEEFENSNIHHFRFNCPPKYIYYKIVFIDDLLKSIFLEHLKESILGYTKIDFINKEVLQINRWFAFLEN